MMFGHMFGQMFCQMFRCLARTRVLRIDTTHMCVAYADNTHVCIVYIHNTHVIHGRFRRGSVFANSWALKQMASCQLIDPKSHPTGPTNSIKKTEIFV